jgi:hypothetical protein
MTTEHAHVAAMRVHLNQLKSQFDSAMCNGETFAPLKKIYMQIKELESEIPSIVKENNMLPLCPSHLFQARCQYNHCATP